jgi:TonB family protein
MKNRINKGSILGLLFTLLLLSGFTDAMGQTLENLKPTAFDKVDEMPVPPGGMDGWIKHMTENLKYPQTARDKKIEGMVVLTFIVKEDGSVSDVEILRGIGAGCDEEGKRVVEISPKWTPGKIGGKAVNTRMTLPINFKLS